MSMHLTGLCREHSFESAAELCRRCGLEYCEACVVYPFGARKPLCKSCAIAMSGLDMALWDIRGKAVGWPLYKLLGGSARPIPAYAGGIALGYQCEA